MSGIAVSVRAAARRDIDAVVEIHARRPGLSGRAREQFEAELERPRSYFLIAEEAGAAAAFACAREVAGELQIELLAVAPERSRRGIGRILLGELLSRAKAAGCTLATLEVAESNAAARGLYASAGFSVVGRRAKYYNDGGDALLMELRL